MTKFTPRPCLDCAKTKFSYCPMLIDKLWLSIANLSDLICLDCVETRLGRRIELDDLTNCGMNKTIVAFALRNYNNPS